MFCCYATTPTRCSISTKSNLELLYRNTTLPHYLSSAAVSSSTYNNTYRKSDRATTTLATTTVSSISRGYSPEAAMNVPGEPTLPKSLVMCSPLDHHTIPAAAATTAGGGGDATSEPGSLLSSQMTGREFGDSMYTTDVEQPTNNPKFPKFPSCSSLSVSTCSERPAALLEKSTGSLTSVTSGSKPPSERSNISLTPPSRVTRSLSNLYGSHLETGRRLTVGLLIVVLIALSWVGSTQTAKSSFAGNHGVFKAPFFVMWFGTGWMMVLYPLSCLLFCVQHWKKCGVAGLRELWR